MSYKSKLALNLQLFAEGGAAAAGDGAGDGATQSNSGATVVYGKQTETVNQQVADANSNPQTPDLKAEFDEIVKGKYKAEFDARVQKAVNSRVKNLKGAEDRLNAMSPMLQMLGQKYGVDSTDVDALNKAIQEDNSYYEQEALEKGVTVEQLKEFKRLERENAEFRRMNQETERRQSFERLVRDSEELKQIYPNFDLEVELNNPDFRRILQVPGMPVRTAYEVIHKDEIIPAAMQFTAQKVQQNTINNIIANGNRPIENGVSSQGAAVSKTDPSKYTSKDLAEIKARVQRGEKIVL